MNFKSLSRDIIDLDESIRFAGIISMNNSKILAAEYRHGIDLLLNPEESELSLMQSLIKMSMTKSWEEKLGKVVYATTVYEKIKSATISIYNNSNSDERVVKEEEKGREWRHEDNDDQFLIVSFERKADHDALITKTIIPFLNNIGKGLIMVG